MGRGSLNNSMHSLSKANVCLVQITVRPVSHAHEWTFVTDLHMEISRSVDSNIEIQMITILCVSSHGVHLSSPGRLPCLRWKNRVHLKAGAGSSGFKGVGFPDGSG